MNCNLKMLLAAATLGAANVRAVSLSLSAQAYLESMLDNGGTLSCMDDSKCSYKEFELLIHSGEDCYKEDGDPSGSRYKQTQCYTWH